MKTLNFTFEDFKEYCLRQTSAALFEIIVSLSIHGGFGKYAYMATTRRFNYLAVYFGLGYVLIINADILWAFTARTVFFYSLFFYMSKKLNKTLKCNVSKYCMILYASVCFQFYEIEDEHHEFISILVVMSIKLLCVTEHRKRFEKATCFNFIAYLFYHPWISYENFLQLRLQRNKLTKNWWILMVISVIMSIFFRLLSRKYIPYDLIYDGPLKPMVHAVLRGIRYRFMYYYRAYIAQIELLAARVKTYGWQENLIFGFDEIELSYAFIYALKFINKPTTEFCFERFRDKHNGIVKVSAQLWFLVIIYCNSVGHGALFTLFCGSLYLQDPAIVSLQRYIGICFFYCGSPICEEKIQKNYRAYYFLQFILVIQHQFRMSLLFVGPEDVFFSFKCLIFLIAIDIFIITFCATRITGKLHQTVDQD